VIRVFQLMRIMSPRISAPEAAKAYDPNIREKLAATDDTFWAKLADLILTIFEEMEGTCRESS
jgi:hypothetical protein